MVVVNGNPHCGLRQADLHARGFSRARDLIKQVRRFAPAGAGITAHSHAFHCHAPVSGTRSTSTAAFSTHRYSA